MDYDMSDYEIFWLDGDFGNNEPVDAFSTIVHRDKVEAKGRHFEKKEILPRQLLKIALQASVGGKVLPEKQSVL